jgi:broad specificity phosphatase PhoE
MAGDRTVVHLLRHGEVYNPEGVLYGRLPGYYLSDLGKEMAVRAADALAGNDVTLVVSSPMERAQQTSAPISERHALPIEIDPDIIEADNIFEGQRVSVGDGVLKQPRTWRHLYNPFRPSWGEPYDEVAERMHRAIRRADTRPSSSATSCRSGSPGSRPRSAGCGTTPAVVSARSRPSRR